jgi:lysophospholipase L1-like esterase
MNSKLLLSLCVVGSSWMDLALSQTTETPDRGASSQAELRFFFGPGPAPSGYTRVAPDATYTKERGCGFEEGAKVAAVERGGTGCCASETPFFFSVAVPEGNYRVTVTMGGDERESATTVKAELRRLMLERVQAGAGQSPSATWSFLVNVRTPKIAGTDLQVRLKAPRETTQEAWAWDEKLTLEFNGARPCVGSLVIERADVPTVFILGDSTVCDQSREPYASWGQMLPRFFKPEVAVANHAESGETLRSSTQARRLEKVLSLMRSGDYLLIQFGHNDMKSKEPDAPLAYKAALKTWVQQARELGGIPVLITPVNRHSFEGGTITNSLREYPEMVRQAAADEGVALIDLNAMSKSLYEALGPKESIRLFKHNADLTEFDGTHHSPYGAYELAKCIVAGIRQSKLDLARHLADDVPAFDPNQPDRVADFKVPPSPQFTNQRPLGD